MATKETKSHRKVKNPETFRQKALKASIEESKQNPIKRLIKKLVFIIYLPFRLVGAKIAKNKIAKAVWKILRKPFRIIGLIILPRYIRNSWKELKLVTWPNWKTSRKLTTAVIVFAIVFGITVAIVDFLLNKLFRNILLK